MLLWLSLMRPEIIDHVVMKRCKISPLKALARVSNKLDAQHDVKIFCFKYQTMSGESLIHIVIFY